MKRLLIPLSILTFLTFLVVTGLFWWTNNIKPPSNDSSLKSFLITKGTSASVVGEKLYKEGFIKSPLAFKIYVQVTGLAKRVPAGEYRLPANLPLPALIKELLAGPAEIWITIPEGLRREEVVEKFIQTFELTGELKGGFRDEFLSLTRNDEGYLFPDTYLFPRTASASIVAKRMKTVFDSQITEDIKKAISASGYTLNQIVILASILERETKTDEERPIVAGILLKRLKADWPLQADATLQYAVANTKYQMLNAKCANWWPILTKEDLEINSPYNSYKKAGLPPTSIANPGLSSIKAVVYPQESSYWFYLHDASGQIHYAETLEEHNRNVKNFLGK